MVTSEAQPSPLLERISTGVPELDEMLAGGLLPHRPYLLVGPPGSGKTTLALQFLIEGIRRGEEVLYVTLEEPPNEVRADHMAMGPEVDQIHVFDAVPDIMRYERVPFQDISSVREAVRFRQVPLTIRQTPEFESVEVTMTSLQPTLRQEVRRRHYRRMVIDSLTALQFFCMPGVDETQGAQTFLRFLSDLGTTTLLTLEVPGGEEESEEHLLARGELRLFRWEAEGKSQYAIGVEKFRGSSHDIHLHPYRISPRGLDINLSVTIPSGGVAIPPTRTDAVEVLGVPPEEVAYEIRRSVLNLDQDIRDLVEVGVDVKPMHDGVRSILTALADHRFDDALVRLRDTRSLADRMIQSYQVGEGVHRPKPPEVVPVSKPVVNAVAVPDGLGSPVRDTGPPPPAASAVAGPIESPSAPRGLPVTASDMTGQPTPSASNASPPPPPPPPPPPMPSMPAGAPSPSPTSPAVTTGGLLERALPESRTVDRDTSVVAPPGPSESTTQPPAPPPPAPPVEAPLPPPPTLVHRFFRRTPKPTAPVARTSTRVVHPPPSASAPPQPPPPPPPPPPGPPTVVQPPSPNPPASASPVPTPATAPAVGPILADEPRSTVELTLAAVPPGAAAEVPRSEPVGPTLTSSPLTPTTPSSDAAARPITETLPLPPPIPRAPKIPRRAVPAAPRKRRVKPGEIMATPSPPSPEANAIATPPPETQSLSPPPVVPPRRTPKRKRKAPSVTSADPGRMPAVGPPTEPVPTVTTVSSEPTAPPAPDPPTET